MLPYPFMPQILSTCIKERKPKPSFLLSTYNSTLLCKITSIITDNRTIGWHNDNDNRERWLTRTNNNKLKLLLINNNSSNKCQCCSTAAAAAPGSNCS